MNGKPIVCNTTGQIWYSYRDYLNSPQWLAKLKHIRDSGKYRCICCRSGKQLTAHHKRYSTIGHEAIKDLLIMCNECHDKHAANLIDYDNPPKFAMTCGKGSPKPPQPPTMSSHREQSLNRARTIL